MRKQQSTCPRDNTVAAYMPTDRTSHQTWPAWPGNMQPMWCMPEWCAWRICVGNAKGMTCPQTHNNQPYHGKPLCWVSWFLFFFLCSTSFKAISNMPLGLANSLLMNLKLKWVGLASARYFEKGDLGDKGGELQSSILAKTKMKREGRTSCEEGRKMDYICDARVGNYGYLIYWSY